MSGASQRRKKASKDHVERTSARPTTNPYASKHRDNNDNDNNYTSSKRGRGDGKQERGGGGKEFRRRSMVPAVGFYVLLLAALVVLTGVSFWSFNRPSSLEQQPAGAKPSNSSVYERGLVSPRVSYQTVLSEHARYWNNVSHRHFQSSVLAYVTPWNGKGYDMAKLFRAKFTHVSPVWYQLRGEEGLSLHGRHDVDLQWIKDVRREGSPLILPRVVLEGWPLDMLVKREERTKAIRMIVNEIMEMEFDGIVLEAWTLWRGHRILEDTKLRKKALEFVKVLGMEFQSMKGAHLYSSGPPQLIFVIPPPGKPRDPSSFSSSDLSYLSDVVHGFSLMTYDYSSAHYPGPNAPLPWVRQCLQLLFPSGAKEGATKSDNREKMLMGINFYGNDYVIPQGGGPIVGGQFTSLLAQHKPQITWDEASQEHYLEYMNENPVQKRNRVYFPSLKSLEARLKEAETWGVGISIWEIGQGLDYFFDLL
ncbi:unnamed protein product [Calypogeia fissa]